MSNQGLMPILKPLLIAELALIAAVFFFVILGLKFVAGIFLILAFFGLMVVLWVISSYLIYTGSKSIWKDFNS